MAGTRRFDENIVRDALLATFWRHGWRGTSMDMLAEAAGLQKGSLQNAYGNKEAMFLMSLDRYSDGMRVLLAKEPDDGSPLGAARAYLRAVASRLTNSHTPPGCLTTLACLECETLPPRAADYARGQLDAAIEALAKRFEENAGPSYVGATALAVFVVGSARGMAVMGRIGRSANEIEAYRDQSLAQVEITLASV